MTAVKFCPCNHKFQDQTYGQNMRVCNKTAGGWRCTVCDKDIMAASDSKKKKK